MKKKQIVFFCATAPYIMVYKMAKEFQRRGFETVLITISQRDVWNQKFYGEAFDKIICSNFRIFKPNPKNLVNMIKRFPYLIKSLYQMRKLRPYVIFDIARPNYIAAIFMKFFRKYPIIYFPADISSHLHADLKSALKAGKKLYEIKAERYCFENADGVLHKGPPEALYHLKRKNMLGSPLMMTKRTLCFDPYCSDEFIVPINKNKLSKKDGCLHLVYVGSFYNGKQDVDLYIEFFKRLIKQKVHIHLYAKTHHLSKQEDTKNISPIIDGFKKNKYFHVDLAFPPKERIYEISKYDFGFFIEPLRPEGVEHTFATGNKVATYFEAGIPFVYSASYKFINDLLRRYELDLPIDSTDISLFDTLKRKLKKLNYPKIEKKIVNTRKDFNMTQHFPRLERFIEEVVKYKHI